MEAKYLKQQLLTGESILVRPAFEEDALALKGVIKTYIADSSYLLLTTDEFDISLEAEKKWINSFHNSDNSILLIALHEGAVIGNIDINGHPRRRMSHTGTIGMGLQKKWRNKGVGSILMKEAINWAIQNPALEKLILHVFSTNERAIHLYQKNGFIEEGRQVRAIKYENGLYVDNVIMGRSV